MSSSQYSPDFLKSVKFLLCNILPGISCIWNDVYEIRAKTFLEVCGLQVFMCALVSRPAQHNYKLLRGNVGLSDNITKKIRWVALIMSLKIVLKVSMVLTF